MTRESMSRARKNAEAVFKKRDPDLSEPQRAAADYSEAHRTTLANMARLKTLRLARPQPSGSSIGKGKRR